MQLQARRRPCFPATICDICFVGCTRGVTKGSVPHVQGLIPTTINRQSGTGGATFSVGAAADSYYEYLLKLWLLGGQKVSQHHPVGK